MSIDNIVDFPGPMAERQSNLGEFRKSRKVIKKFLDTVRYQHSAAYQKGADEHLTDASGEIDYDLLEDEATGDKFSDSIIDHYVSNLDELLNTKDAKSLPQHKKDLLLKAVGGLTTQQLKQAVRKAGKKFTVQAYNNIADELMENMAKELSQQTYAHIKETPEEIEKTFGEMKELHGKLDPKRLSLGDLVTLMDEYIEGEGQVKPDIYRNMLAYKKPHKKAA